MPIQIELFDYPHAHPLVTAYVAAKICREQEVPIPPQIEKQIADFTETKLYKTGHHTTFQHGSFVYTIQDIAVGDVTFGLHLCHPFYNSDQKSGRVSADMFIEPNLEDMETYIRTFWPDLIEPAYRETMEYIRECYALYNRYLPDATKIAADFLRKERPHLSEKRLPDKIKSVAQEQMRMCIPIIAPTNLEHSLNLSALFSLWRVAWTPALRHVTDVFAKLVIQKFPEIKFMFDPSVRKTMDWTPEMGEMRELGTKTKPTSIIREVQGTLHLRLPEDADMHPVDTLPFSPEFMTNNAGAIFSTIECSIATMGQDQRHRTLLRTAPDFIGDMYVPPIPAHLNLHQQFKQVLERVICLKNIPATLRTILMPYGAMVEYKKNGAFNAIIHETDKRLCWTAQEEIYHANLYARQSVEKQFGPHSKLLELYKPPCHKTGICTEGGNYCGRDRKLHGTDAYFAERKV